MNAQVIPWTPQEDAIIIRHAEEKKYLTKNAAYVGAAEEIFRVLHTNRSPSACSQRHTKRMNTSSRNTAVAIISKTAAPITSMAYDVAVMAIQRLQPHERLRLVERMLNNEL